MKPPSWLLLLVILAALGVGRFTFGFTVQVTRTVRVTDTINEELRSHGLAMFSDLKGYGCEESSLVGFISPDKPRELILVMTCTKWAEGATYAPAKK